MAVSSDKMNGISVFSGSPAVRDRAARGLPSTPPTNRGVDVSHNRIYSSVFSVDTMRFTVHGEREEIIPLLDVLGVSGGLEVIGHGGTGFQVIESGLNGFQLYSEPVGGRSYFSFNLPGKFLQSLGHDRLCKVWDWLCSSGLRFNTTRIDLAFDQQDFITAQFVDAYNQGLVETRSIKFKEVKTDDGHTFYIGSRSSEAMLRVYDKSDGASFGEGQPFTRVELELKGDRAALGALEVFAADITQQHMQAVKMLNGFVSVAADFWRDFLITAKSSWLRLRQPVSTVQKIEQWIEKSVLPSLSTLLAAKSGGDLDEIRKMFNKFMQAGQEKWSPRHYKMIKDYSGDLTPEFICAV